ncbi:MAG: TadE/TadG family type IV pilus assembly protein [Chromatiales bacterium]
MRYPRQQGLVMVEFTIVLPLLLLLMFAAAEFGRALFQYNTLIKSVRDGGRYLAANAFLGDATQVNTAAQTQTQNLVAYGAIGKTACQPTSTPPFYPPCDDLKGFNAADVTYSNPVQDADGNYYVTVSATYNYAAMLGAALPFTSADMTIPLRASVTMRVLSP